MQRIKFHFELYSRNNKNNKKLSKKIIIIIKIILKWGQTVKSNKIKFSETFDYYEYYNI